MQEELVDTDLAVVTVALDIDPEQARPWIEAAVPSEGADRHIALVDSAHQVDEALGINNVPMAVWIDDTGRLVRPAESASIVESELRSVEISPDLPERLQVALTEIKKIPESAEEYRAAIVDWAHRGAESRFVLSADEVIARSAPRPRELSEAAAWFELGQHVFRSADDPQAGKAAAKPLWQRAHALDPHNWTYKRQAWTLESTAEGEPSDLFQEVADSYGTSWLDDVLELGGGENYGIAPRL